MSSLVVEVRARLQMPVVRKLIKYSMVSVIAVAITMVLQVFCFGILRFGPAKSAIIASSVAAVPSYYLNRGWVWRKSGRSHLTREVLPFWSMALIGLAASTGASSAAEKLAKSATESHALHTLIVVSASFSAFAVLWVLKFVIFNKILFAHHPQDLDPALDGRTGLPT